MKKHPKASRDFIADESRTDWHNAAVYNFRRGRDATAKSIPEWEELRSLASQIKDNVLANLDDYLVRFEAAATANGIQVHWAADAAEHNRIVHEILERHRVRRVVKSKSMLTEECHLNEYLEERNIEIIDTDLGERIIQLKEEPPSHIVAPAIHLKREEVGDLFTRTLQTEPGNNDPTYLTRAARAHLREKFLGAQAGITGVNFGVVQTGGIVVVTNEGNADLGINLPPVQIHCMGIEKILPRWEDLGVFTRLLAASAAGQRISIYTSHYFRPKPGGEMHIVLVDNGRSRHLGRKDYRNSLKCIRCSACFNTCPVYRRSGGHSYHTAIAGPIGSILMPGRDLKEFSDLPFASSLCGSCSDVCPVKIDIHEQLYKWRQEVVEQGFIPGFKKQALKMTGNMMTRPKAMQRVGKLANSALKLLPRWVVYNPLNAWGQDREMPQPPTETFSDWYKKNRR